MWGIMREKRARVRSAIIAVFAMAFMSVGLVAASAQYYEGASIWATSDGCESVTIHYQLNDYKYRDIYQGLLEFPGFNAQGTVNGVVKNGNGTWSTEIEFTGVAAGLATWSGSMWWDYGLLSLESQSGGQYFDQGTVQVEPCPVTTTTQPTATTTQPTDTSSSTIAQVETDLPDSGGSGFGLSLVIAGFVAALLGGVAVRAARIDD